MVELASAFASFRPFTALVIGDFFFDTYITGRVKRISPEAPVPVLEVLKQTSQPGGAGNVALNLAALNATVFAVGRIGDDGEGHSLKRCLEKASINTSFFVAQPSYKTPVKNRFIADSQQLLRVDFETVQPLSPELEDHIIAELAQLIEQVEIVAISDYAKGFLSRRLIEWTIRIARLANVPVIVDPKGSDFTKYRFATILKPNLGEAYAAANMSSATPLDEVARVLLEVSQVDMLLITRSEAGMSLFQQGQGRKDFPVRAREVKDVTGAGDTVLSFICLSLACGLDIHQAAQLANLAACLSVERLGCVQVGLAELAQRLLEEDRDRKVFNENHVYALRHMLRDKKYSLFVLPQGQTMSHQLLRTISTLSSKEQQPLMVYIDDAHPADEFVHLLSSLKAVDMIVLRGDSLQHFCHAMNPDRMYCLEGEEVYTDRNTIYQK